MGYLYWHQGIEKGGQIGAIMNYAARKGLSATWMTEELKRKNLSYRRADMLYDFRRTSIVGRAKSLEAMQKANDFFENIIEKIRKDRHTDLKEAIEIWERIRQKHIELEEMTEEEEEIWDIYESLW